MSIYSDLLHNPILEAVGAALAHSLWQGALVGVGLYVALKVFKSAGSSDALCRFVVRLWCYCFCYR